MKGFNLFGINYQVQLKIHFHCFKRGLNLIFKIDVLVLVYLDMEISGNCLVKC